jgi:hypothetical protein
MVAVAVSKGVKFVCENYGHDWYNHVDPDTLRMMDARNCILGQLESHKMGAGNGFYQALNRLGISQIDADEMGFTIESLSRECEWEPLTNEWKRRIRNMRETFADQHIVEVDEHEPEPYVNIHLVFKDTLEPHEFVKVRGAAFRDGLLTFEDEAERIFYVPNVLYWFNVAGEE